MLLLSSFCILLSDQQLIQIFQYFLNSSFFSYKDKNIVMDTLYLYWKLRQFFIDIFFYLSEICFLSSSQFTSSQKQDVNNVTNASFVKTVQKRMSRMSDLHDITPSDLFLLTRQYSLYIICEIISRMSLWVMPFFFFISHLNLSPLN